MTNAPLPLQSTGHELAHPRIWPWIGAALAAAAVAAGLPSFTPDDDPPAPLPVVSTPPEAMAPAPSAVPAGMSGADIDWSRVEAAPEPAGVSVAAYGD